MTYRTAPTADRQPLTRRDPKGGYASEGSVNQDGPLPIYCCTKCNTDVVWATSRKTGKKYLVNVRRGALDQRFYMKHDAHQHRTEAGA